MKKNIINTDFVASFCIFGGRNCFQGCQRVVFPKGDMNVRKHEGQDAST